MPGKQRTEVSKLGAIRAKPSTNDAAGMGSPACCKAVIVLRAATVCSSLAAVSINMMYDHCRSGATFKGGHACRGKGSKSCIQPS